MSNESIHIILDTTNPQAAVFVEIENDEGKSIRIGEWVESPDSRFQHIKITAEDIAQHPQCRGDNET